MILNSVFCAKEKKRERCSIAQQLSVASSLILALPLPSATRVVPPPGPVPFSVEERSLGCSVGWAGQHTASARQLRSSGTVRALQPLGVMIIETESPPPTVWCCQVQFYRGIKALAKQRARPSGWLVLKPWLQRGKKASGGRKPNQRATYSSQHWLKELPWTKGAVCTGLCACVVRPGHTGMGVSFAPRAVHEGHFYYESLISKLRNC